MKLTPRWCRSLSTSEYRKSSSFRTFALARAREFASRACRPEADALLCSCTAWRSLEAVAELERRIGKPVVTSNQASIWAAYRALGLAPKITGFGRLLESLAA